MDEKMLLEAIGKMIAPINEKQTHMQSIMENMDKKIDALFEGQKNINDKFEMLEDMAERLENIEITVNALEDITKTNTTEIKQLKMVK